MKHSNLCDLLDNEIKNFRNGFSIMFYTEIYNSWYKIGFYEEYYEMLRSDFGETRLSDKQIEWLESFKEPLGHLYDIWLDCDGAMSHDWDDMINWLLDIYNEEKSSVNI